MFKINLIHRSTPFFLYAIYNSNTIIIVIIYRRGAKYKSDWKKKVNVLNYIGMILCILYKKIKKRQKLL